MTVTARKGVGAVIGRFQVADLHEGHHSVIQEAAKHSKFCIFIGVNPSQLNTQSDPLDYPTREQMLKLAYPKAQVYELVDQYTDVGWSNSLNDRLGTLYPRDKVTLYCGRDSFKSHYSGKHTVFEVDSVEHLSGTALRDIDGATVENHASFRRGLIYGAYNRWTPIYPCVDIACTRKREDGDYEVLVGHRDNEGSGVMRFPGGHVDPTDKLDADAARRELSEETGVAAGPMKYLWSGAINSWVDREGGGVKRTTFFQCDYLHGAPQGKDDLPHVQWVRIKSLDGLLWADSHKKLARILQEQSWPFGATQSQR